MLASALAVGLLISATLWILQSKTAEKSPSVANTENNEIIPADSNAHPSETVKPIPDRASPENAVAENTASENANARELSVTRQPTPYEELLFQAAVKKRRAAVKAFREQTGKRIASQPEKPKQNPPDHAAIVRALLPRSDANALARLARREENAALQEEIFAAMLAQGDVQSVGFYLDFVSNRDYADRALHALDGMKTPPVDLLFDFLHVAQAPRRLAAALTLGRIDGPETARKLYQMVRGSVGRQEALVALLASSGEDASHYVSLAQRDISLAGIFNGARYQYRLLSSTQ
jgi:hypothetical protein